MKFEEASKELDKIIEQLENGNLTLDESVLLFEKAKELIDVCEKDFKTAKGTLAVVKENIETIVDKIE